VHASEYPTDYWPRPTEPFLRWIYDNSNLNGDVRDPTQNWLFQKFSPRYISVTTLISPEFQQQMQQQEVADQMAACGAVSCGGVVRASGFAIGIGARPLLFRLGIRPVVNVPAKAWSIALNDAKIADLIKQRVSVYATFGGDITIRELE